MPLLRLSARKPASGQYLQVGAFNAWVTLNNPANPTAGIPASPFSSTWAGISALTGMETDRPQQLTQKSTHLIVLPFQKVTENMTVTFNDGDEIRTFQIEYITDPDELGRELHLYAFEMEQNAGSGAIVTPPTPGFTSGSGAPTTILTDGSIYWDQTSGNLYEQTYGQWTLVGNVGTGGGEMPSTPYHKISAASNNAAVIKAAPGTVTGWKVYNAANYPIYAKLYDKATNPNPAVDVPKQVIGVDAGESDVVAGSGYTYGTGIAIAIVKNISDSDNTPVLANDCSVDIFYQ